MASIWIRIIIKEWKDFHPTWSDIINFIDVLYKIEIWDHLHISKCILETCNKRYIVIIVVVVVIVIVIAIAIAIATATATVTVTVIVIVIGLLPFVSTTLSAHY